MSLFRKLFASLLSVGVTAAVPAAPTAAKTGLQVQAGDLIAVGTEHPVARAAVG